MNKRLIHIMGIGVVALLLAACNKAKEEEPSPEPAPGPVVPEGWVAYTPTDELFANPERGFFIQHYYKSNELDDVFNPLHARANREGDYQTTLYLHSYYMTDFMDGPISQECLNRLEANMQGLRAGGAKCVLRFAYKSGYAESDKPWDPTPEIVAQHIQQIKPYLQEYADVIFTMQAGFIGSWGEWYYTEHFNFHPSTAEEYEPRWRVAEALMDALPATRQIGFRYPALKMTYMQLRGYEVKPLDENTAFDGSILSRWAAHNDCFVSSENDVGTYHGQEDRAFLYADTRYVVNGGETCNPCYFSNGTNALKEMAKAHITYLNKGYHQEIINSWIESGQITEMKRRMGYRLVMQKGTWTKEPKAGEKFEVTLTIKNEGFAAPVNPRDVELILVQDGQKHVYKQDIDPRHWFGGETGDITMSAMLPENATGTYTMYLNLPDPYENLHNNPDYSIRLANKNVWEPATGYNKLGTFTIQ